MPKRKQIQDACMLSTFFLCATACACCALLYLRVVDADMLAVTSPARIDDCNKTALIAGKAQKRVAQTDRSCSIGVVATATPISSVY
jgi:hypothetical protein